MRVLCFTNSTYKYNTDQNSYYGGGWIDSLMYLLENDHRIKLGLSFCHPKHEEKKETSTLVYYPIYKAPRSKNRLKTIIGDWLGRIENEEIFRQLQKVIEDFKPDVIQVFGTEAVFAGIQKYTDVPVLVHIQGLLNPYYNTYYPINQSKWNFILDPIYLIQNILGKGPSFSAKRFYKMSQRETRNFKYLKFVSGRTEWDKMVAKISNPDIKYFHIDEVLRPIFYDAATSAEVSMKGGILQIVSTISPTIYKGIDVILKTAKLLTTQTDVKFCWKIIGLEKHNPLVKHYQKSLGISHENVNIEFVGIKRAEEFIKGLLDSDIYIHPSYIDNSPNSVCEAQILGLPVIACNVGGLNTIIDHGKTGLLVPANGIYEIVHHVKEYTAKTEAFKEIGRNAKKRALLRHDRETILKSLISCYKTICEKD